MNPRISPRRGPGAWWGLVLAVLGIAAVVDRMEAATPAPSLRTLRVPLSGQESNRVGQSWPGIGCWFWTARELVPEGYKAFIDDAARYSAFGLLTTSLRVDVEVTDAAVHDQLKRAAEYARERGLGMVLDLDVRLARKAFMTRHGEELQEIVRLRQVGLSGDGPTTLFVESVGGGDHYTFRAPPYAPVKSRLLRVYSYVAGPGGVRASTLQDITGRCEVTQADAKGVRVVLPGGPGEAGRTACVFAVHSLFTPDVFAPHLMEFERGILKQYADVPLAGVCKDEWGFPGGMANASNLWYSAAMARAYAERRPGHDLVRDLVLMSVGEEARDPERAAAINHYMEMNWQRNAAVENAFHDGIKEIWGPEAMVATHPTWFPYPNAQEAFKNGIHWWACRRDLAQTDEATPFAARTSLAKRWRSPVWFNMYYDGKLASYETDLWRHLLGGGRMNFHPQFPGPWEPDPWSLASSRVLKADARIGLLNLIATAPVECPVAVVFGHPGALNWAGRTFGDVGLELCNSLWAEGFYTDLIPSSEIVAGNLKLTPDGRVQYGPQTYAAVVLYEPDLDHLEVRRWFHQAAAGGRTRVLQVGTWSRDFEGKPVPAVTPMPGSLRQVGRGEAAVEVLQYLRQRGVEPQTRSTLHTVAGFPASMMPLPVGMCRLLDGTVVVGAGQNDVMGDPIRRTLVVPWRPARVNGNSGGGTEVTIDAIGLAAVRVDALGRVEALAAGGLKQFRSPTLNLELAERVDLALWRNAQGQWQGVILGLEGSLPPALETVTGDWTRLRWPTVRATPK